MKMLNIYGVLRTTFYHASMCLSLSISNTSHWIKSPAEADYVENLDHRAINLLDLSRRFSTFIRPCQMILHLAEKSLIEDKHCATLHTGPDKPRTHPTE